MQLIDHQLLLFGGKGGVGKTVCAAATAIYAASQGKKTLIISTDPAHSLGDSLEKEIGNKITIIRKNLDALEIDAASLLQEYQQKHGSIIQQIIEEGTFFSRGDIQDFFDLSLPGMDELMALLKVIDLLEENKYDLLILDTAPSGHTIRLLELPDLMITYVKVLAEMRQKHRVVVSMMTRKYVKDEADAFIEKMDQDVKRIKTVLQDATTTKFLPITIPEAMSVRETERLMEVLRKHHIPVEEMLVNGVMKENCAFCKSRKLNQEKYLQEIKRKFSDCKITEITLFPTEIKGKTLETLAKVLFGEKYQLPPAPPQPTAEITFDKLTIKTSIEFLLFGGKGGVGKTSCAAAVALRESTQKKVLVFSTDPAHSLSDSFGITLGNSITKIKENLDGLETDSQALLENLKKKYKKEIKEFFSSVFRTTTGATIDAPYDRKVMEDLFDLAPPGIDEIMALKTMMDLMQEKKYDLFILDTAPTGHTIRLLEMPEIAEEWVKALLDIEEKYPIPFEIGEALQEMLSALHQVREILVNPGKTEFIIIAIPEALALSETEDLVRSLKRMQVPTEHLIINRIIPRNDCAFCQGKRTEQGSYIKKFQELGLKTVGVRLFENEITGIDALRQLGEELY